MLLRKLIVSCLVLFSVSAFAVEKMAVNAAASNDGVNETAIKLKIMSHVPRVQVFSINQSAITGLYEVDTNAGMIYITKDGNYFIEGDLYTFTDNTIKNLTEEKLDKKRAAELVKLNPKDMIIFSPPKGSVKATITVFTDIDCGYCRKLHEGMAQMNALGIEVRYMAFPRAGLASDSYKKLVSSWCAANPQEALTKAKKGESVPDKTCNNPVASQFQLGQKMGIEGTPAIILADGKLLPGYAPPEKLAEMIGITKGTANKLVVP